MKNKIISLIVWSVLGVAFLCLPLAAFSAQPKGVMQDPTTKRVTDDIKIPSGKVFTVETGGSIIVPTAAADTSTTQAASTAFAKAEADAAQTAAASDATTKANAAQAAAIAAAATDATTKANAAQAAAIAAASSDSATKAGLAADNDFTGNNSFTNYSRNPTTSLATGTQTAAIGKHYVTTLTSNLTISALSGTLAADAKVVFELRGCNGTAVFDFTGFGTAKRNGATNATSTSLTPTAGNHTVAFLYDLASTTWYYSDTVASPVNLAGGATSVTGVLPAANVDTALMRTADVDTVAELVSVLQVPVEFLVAIGDETTALTTGTAKVTFRSPYVLTLSEIRTSLTTASSSGLPTINIKENGTTIFSTKPTIDASEKTSTTAATAAVLSDTSIADDSEITVDVDVAGTGAAGLKVLFKGYR